MSNTVRTDLSAWLCDHLATAAGVPREQVDPDRPMVDYGLDSLTAAAVLAAVQERVGIEVDPNCLWDYPTAAQFADHVAGLVTD